MKDIIDHLEIMMSLDTPYRSLKIEEIQNSDFFKLKEENKEFLIYEVECHLPLLFYNKKDKTSSLKLACEYCLSLNFGFEELKFEIMNGNGKNCLYECSCLDCKRTYLR